MENGPYSTPWREQAWESEGESGGVERQLAHYAFVREERDREVRLLFRDVPPPEVAAAFRAARAALISVSGERQGSGAGDRGSGVGSRESGAGSRELEADGEEEAWVPPPHRKRAREAGPEEPSGEVMLRYFFALRETVYTVNIAVPSGVAGSIAGTYPSARVLERELEARLHMVFT